ncbi:MAG: hypothetical protein AAF738_03595, partial [Bacteroidota bacterium]
MPLLLFFMCCFGGVVVADTWPIFESATGKFQVRTPVPMQQHADTTATPVGELIYHTYVAQDEEQQIYMLTYCDYPEGSLHSDSTDLVNDFFDATIASAAESVQGKVLYIHKDKLQKQHHGKRWRIDYLDGAAIIRTRAFVVGQRYYSVQVVSRRAGHAAANR